MSFFLSKESFGFTIYGYGTIPIPKGFTPIEADPQGEEQHLQHEISASNSTVSSIALHINMNRTQLAGEMLRIRVTCRVRDSSSLSRALHPHQLF